METLTKEQLDQIEQFGYGLCSPPEICIIMQISESHFIGDTEARRRYQRGKLMSEAKIRHSIVELAIKGSSPAQILAVQLIKDLDLKEISL